MPAAPSADLSVMDRLSSELMDRLSKESARPAAAGGTALVGGLVKAGAKLEDLLREVVVAAAAFERCEPELLLAAIGGPKGQKPKLQKAMAGALAHGLRQWYAAKRRSATPAFARPLIEDLLDDRSAILGFINVRNAVAKTGSDPSVARPALVPLAAVIREFRVANGWS